MGRPAQVALNSVVRIVNIVQMFIVFVLLLSAASARGAGDVSPTSRGSSTSTTPSVQRPYCDQVQGQIGPKGRCDLDTLAKGIWNAAASSRFVNDCPRPCSGLKVVNRAGWGAPTPKRCGPEEKAYVQQVDRTRIAERRAYCSKGDVATSEKLVADLRAMEAQKPEPMCVFPMEATPKTLVLHHSGGVFFRKPGIPVGPAQLLGYHKGKNEWADIGYHYIVAADEKGKWNVYEGREQVPGEKCKWMMGAHLGPGANDGSLGILIVGNYNTEKEDPGAAQLLGPNPPQAGAIAKVTELVAKLKKECPGIQEFTGHNDARMRAFGCVNPATGAVDESIGNCGEENKGVKGRAGCKTTCPGVGCNHIPGDIHARVINGR